ncbi:MAG: SDR family oxidoreductase [Candidatus Korarchaeota archaeon]|nr:SDR family oxidoreductase [Candidatus Korarchaeota archaeon]NIU82512.1 NAD-dependent epimerase/dehydratase family protein [Candidatus Thorarchaeota archaeon]NIW12999.1 NAD-dependent epimerase/dehydratase family protein [Candidatus Thorarchaeota archaeon]
MKTLVTGGAGYIGSTLCRMLLNQGHQVKILDRFYFGTESIDEIIDDEDLEIVKDDVRYCDPTILDDIDVVIDMAALSNDPTGELAPVKTWEINYLGRARIARLAKIKGVERYIQASTCSIYGQQEGLLKETASPNPLTTYAKAHRAQEKECLSLADDNFCVTVLRQATVYGLSYRMRFDLAINAMVNAIFETGQLGVMRDGTQWRPFVHIKDTSNAFTTVAETDKETVNGEIFNVGSNEQNYQIKPLADMLRETFDFKVDWEWYGSPDERSYCVDFSKIHEMLDYEVKHTPKEAAKNIYHALQEGNVEKTKKTITVEWYKRLLEAEKLVKELSLKDSIL